MPYLTQNTQIYYTHNKGVISHAPAIVLVHGAGSRHRDWPHEWRQPTSVTQLYDLKPTTHQRRLANYPVYAFDLPGHGRSDPPSRNSIDEYAQDVIEFIEALGLQQVVIVGHSMGGAIVQTIGIHQPSNLAGLILIGTGARLPVPDIILDGWLTDFPKTVRLIMELSWHKRTTAYFKQMATRRLLDNPPTVVYGDFLACNEFDLSDRLAQIRVPTLVIGSTTDRMTPLKYSEFLAEHIPNARLAVIKEAGHYMTVEKTEQVTAAMVKFLKQIQVDGGPS